MTVLFDEDYLKQLYVSGRSNDRKHRFQPSVIAKYIQVIRLMCAVNDVSELKRYNSLNYEKLKGNKIGLSSVRINTRYRIEFEEIVEGGEVYASICNIIRISNHYN